MMDPYLFTSDHSLSEKKTTWVYPQIANVMMLNDV